MGRGGEGGWGFTDVIYQTGGEVIEVVDGEYIGIKSADKVGALRRGVTGELNNDHRDDCCYDVVASAPRLSLCRLITLRPRP